MSAPIGTFDSVANHKLSGGAQIRTVQNRMSIKALGLTPLKSD